MRSSYNAIFNQTVCLFLIYVLHFIEGCISSDSLQSYILLNQRMSVPLAIDGSRIKNKGHYSSYNQYLSQRHESPTRNSGNKAMHKKSEAKQQKVLKKALANIQNISPRRNQGASLDLERRQKAIIAKLLKTKKQGTKHSKWHTHKLQQDIICKKKKTYNFQSLQFQILKPTDRYFQKLENIRLAQKLLLVKPTNQVNRNSLTTFYKQQKMYQINIRKMPSRFLTPHRHNQTNKEQWIF